MATEDGQEMDKKGLVDTIASFPQNGGFHFNIKAKQGSDDDWFVNEKGGRNVFFNP